MVVYALIPGPFVKEGPLSTYAWRETFKTLKQIKYRGNRDYLSETMVALQQP